MNHYLKWSKQKKHLWEYAKDEWGLSYEEVKIAFEPYFNNEKIHHILTFNECADKVIRKLEFKKTFNSLIEK